MTIERNETDYEQPYAASPTDHVLTELQLHGYRPFQDEPDPRPQPEARIVAAAVADIFDALITSLSETRLEPDLEDLLWSTVNLFHRANERIERELDDNEQAQKRSQRDQDGSEIRSVELERLTAEGMTLIERRNSMEYFRDQAAEHFVRHAGSHWHLRSGSLVNHRAVTSAVIDSRDFLAAKRRAETEVLLPAGPKIAFIGGLDCNDHRLIWDKLDQVHAKHPDMVLLHGGSPKGAERIAARWADHRKVPQIAFKPDWTKYAKAAPFKRNDQMLCCLLASSSSRAPAFRRTWLTRHGSSASPSGNSATAARKRHRIFRLSCYPSNLRRGNVRSAPKQRTGPRVFTPPVSNRNLARQPTARDSKRARDRLFPGRRRGGGGRRDPCNLVAGTITMLIIGVLLNIAGLGIFCWALFALATHALPFFVGMTVGTYSFQAGAGLFDAIVVGFIMAGFALVVGQYAFSVARSPVVRLVIGLLFALPAARAGYDATLALAHVGVPPGLVAGGVRHFRRHHRRVHRLGARVDPD